MRSLRCALPRRDNLDILEIGFGRGLLLQSFLERGHSVSGIDPGMLDRSIPESLRRRATLYAEPAESVDLQPGSFDLIYGIHVVEHLDDPLLVFRSCHRALRPGGVAYFMTPNAESVGLRVFREAWWNLEDPTHVRFFSPRSIDTALRGAGFDRVLIHTPWWDSISLEISSLFRLSGGDPGMHGVLSARLVMPAYAALLPLALTARGLWPGLAPSMEVLARKASTVP